MSNITIYHNPSCTTSRKVLAAIRATGAEPRVIEYLKTPPSRAELKSLLGRMGMTPRALLRRRGVTMLAGVEYVQIDAAGLELKVEGKPQLLDVDTVVICAGQEPQRELAAGLEAAGIQAKLIGGADIALELDAKRAIEQGTRVALAL